MPNRRYGESIDRSDMYKIFNLENEYVLPSGEKIPGKDLVKRDEYKEYGNGVWLVRISGENCIRAFYNYDDACEAYGITDENVEVAVNEINKCIFSQNRMNANNRAMAYSVQKAASFAALAFTDEQALEVPDLYPEYEVDHAYKKDERFTYNGRLFKVNQAHTSAAQWVPGETGTESLYTCLEMAGDGYLVWTQPTGAHNAYNTGDIVHYPTEDDPLYKSLIDGNSWSPDAYPQGWQEYDASTSTEPSTPDPGTETPTKPSDPEYPDFVQPTGAHDAYKKGDIVRYNGKLYQSLIDANAYSPDAYPQGWQEYSEE